MWDRSDYVKEAENQLIDTKVYKDISRKDLIPELTEKSNKIFESLKRRGFISENNGNFSLLNLRKLVAWENFILPKIERKMFNVLGRAVISNCGTTTEIFFLNSLV